ncbi:MAG: Tim44/TimA family putative adaptor protein [Rhodospirillales bacterium]|jgi:predicted lipid-binding transport protein (Tim44 family)|nr:Tim44/TimA family putative adaptor protein [Rhodospirillales bacterium]
MAARRVRDMGDGFIDIIFFAMIAAFLVLRLRSVLGRRDGHESGHSDSIASSPGAERTSDKIVHLSDQSIAGEEEDGADPAEADSPLAVGLARIRQGDSSFDENEFLSGARMAFEMILSAYAEGNDQALEPLLSPEVYGNFARAIEDRNRAGETVEETLVCIKESVILEASMEGRTAQVTVKFISEQISVTRNREGEVSDGDPNAVIEVTDFWTFARDTRSRDLNWTLVETRSLD